MCGQDSLLFSDRVTISGCLPRDVLPSRLSVLSPLMVMSRRWQSRLKEVDGLRAADNGLVMLDYFSQAVKQKLRVTSFTKSFF